MFHFWAIRGVLRYFSLVVVSSQTHKELIEITIENILGKVAFK